MSRSVDERAVIMEFDNKQFESGIAQSRKSLEQFEKSLELKGASEAIDKVQKQLNSVDFSGMQKSLETISNRFSAMGIAGMTVIQNLTNEVVNFAKNGIGQILGKINEGGKKRALSLEKSRFLLQGILKDEERVADAMKQANDSVDGTAYSLDAAAKAASTFVATGLEGEKLRSALDAVANLTATVSGNYEDISSIITKVVGSHKLYRQELNQIVSRGFALDQYIAEYIENVNKGVWETTDAVRQNIKDMDLLGKKAVDVSDLTSGKNGQLKAISSDLVMEVLNKKLQGQAKRANETLTGIIDNIGAAWSRIGAMFYEPLVAQNSELVLFLQAVRLSINAIKKGLEPFAKVATDITLKIFGGAKAIAEFTKDSDGVSSAHKPLLELTKLFEAFFNIIKPGLLTFEKFIEITNELFADTILRRINSAILTFSEWASRGSDSFEITEELEQKLKDLGIAFDKATQPLRDFWTMVKAAFYAVFDLSDTTSGIEGFIDNLTSLFNTIAEGNQLTDKQKGGIFSVAYKIFNFIKNTGTNVVKIIETLGGTLMFAFGKLKEFITGFIDFAKPIAQAIKDSGILQSALDLLCTVFEKIGEALSSIPGLIGGLFSSFNGDADPLENFTNILKNIKEWLDKVNTALQNFKIGDGFKGFVDFIKEIFGQEEELSDVPSKMGAGGSMAPEPLTPIASMMQSASKAVDAMGGEGTFEKIKTAIEKWILPLLSVITKVIGAIIAIKIAGTIYKQIKVWSNLATEIAKGAKSWASLPGAIKKTINSGLNKKFIVILVLSLSVLLAAIALLIKVISDIPAENFSKTIITFGVIFGVIIGGIIALMIAVNKMTKNVDKNGANAAQILAINKSLMGIAYIVAAVGAAVALMAVSFRILANTVSMYKPSVLISAGAILLAMITVLGVLIKVISSISSKLKPDVEKTLAKIAALSVVFVISIVGLVGAFKLMAAVVTSIGGVKQAWGIAGIFGAIIGGFALILVALMAASDKWNYGYKVLSSIAGILVALGIFSIAFAFSVGILVTNLAALALLIENSQPETITKALQTLGILAGILAGAAAAILIIMGVISLISEIKGMGQTTIDYKVFIGMGIAFLALSVAVTILTSALTELAALNSLLGDAWPVIGQLGVLVAGLASILAGLSLLAGTFGGASLIVASGAFLTMSIALIALAAAMDLFATAIAKVLLLLDAWSQKDPEEMANGMANGATAMAAGLEKSGPDIIKAIETLFAEGGIIDKIFDSFTSVAERNADKIANSFGKIVDKIYDVMNDKSDKLDFIAEKFGDFLNKAITNLTKGKDVGGLIGDILFGEGSDFNVRAEGLFGTIKEIITRIALFLPETLWNILQGIGAIIEENIESIKTFLINRLHDADDLFKELMISLGKAIENSSEPIISALFFVLGLIIAKTAEFFEAHHDDLLSILGALMLLPLEALSNFLVTNGELILTTLGGITVIFLQWLGILFQELRKWWDEHWEPDVEPFLYTSFMDTLELACKALRDSTVVITTTAVALGFDIIMGLLAGLREGMPGVAEEAVKTIETFRDEICAPERIERVVDAAVGIIENFVNGISEWLEKDENITDLRDSFVRLGEACIKAIKTFFGISDTGTTGSSSPLFGLGTNILDGLGQGLLWAWNNSPLKSAIDTLCNLFMGRVEENVQVNSPSKWAFGVGDYVDEGLALGISKNSNKVVRSVDEMTDDVKSSFTTMIEALKMAGDEEFDINPVITPVVDLSNVTDAANMTSDLFSGHTNAFSMSYNTASALSSGFAYNKPVSSDSTTNNSSIVNFTQNNYSPEPLSHYETYRQTKNLLRTIDSRI